MFWKSLFVNTIGGCILAISAGSYLLKLTSNVHFIKKEGIKQPEFVLKELIGISPQELGSGSGPVGTDTGAPLPAVVSGPDSSPGHTPGPGEVKEVQDAGGAGQAAQELKASPGPTEPGNEAVTGHQKPNATVSTEEKLEGAAVVSGEKPGEQATKQPEAVTARGGGTPSGGVEDKLQDSSTPTASNSQLVQAPSTPTTEGSITQEKGASTGGGVQKEQVSTTQNSTSESAIGHSAPSVPTPAGEDQKTKTPVTSTAPKEAQQNLPSSGSVDTSGKASSGVVNNAQPTTTGGTPQAPSTPTTGGNGKQATTVPAPTEGKQQPQTPPASSTPKPQAPAAPAPTKPPTNKGGRGKGGGGTKSSGPGGKKPWVRARGWSGGGSSRKVKPPENSWLQKGKQKA